MPLDSWSLGTHCVLTTGAHHRAELTGKEETLALWGAGRSACGIDRRSAGVYADVAAQATGAGFVASAFPLFSGD